MKSRFFGATAIALTLAVSHGAQAQDAAALAAKFGAREYIRDVSISPEGKQVVIVAPRPDGGENAVVIDLATTKAVPILSSSGKEDQIYRCEFVLETRVVCSIYLREGSNRLINTATRLASIASDGSDMKLLSAGATSNAYFQSNYGGEIIDYNAPGNPNAVLMTRLFQPENRTSTLIGSAQEGLAVEEVDIVSIKRKRVEAPRATAEAYFTDGAGNVRLMATVPRNDSGYDQGEIIYSYRPVDGRWTQLSRVEIRPGRDFGFMPVAVDAKENVAYGFDTTGEYTALYKMALDGSGTKTKVLSRDDADVDDLITIGRSQRIVGASFVTDKRIATYFDPELKSLAQGLSRALGGGKQISFLDATQGERKLVLYAGSDTDPGAYYIFDKDAGTLGELLPARPELAGVKLGTMKPIQYPAADGTMIPGYLTLPAGSDGKGLPAIVMPHGGPEARDEWGFDWLVQFFAARGYAVLQPNYRGSTGYGATWLKQNAFHGWKEAVSDVNDAGRWLEAEGIAAPGKLAIVGWSYGGYAALQSQVLDSKLFKAVVAIAPVTDLDAWREEWRDSSSFFIIDRRVGNGPHIEAGSPARHPERFESPVLLFHGDGDLNVGVGESRLMEGRLKDAGKQVTYVEFKGLDHQLDDAAARKRLLSESEAFLRKALGIE